jgi:WD40 repeat protein
MACSWSPDSKYLSTASADGTVKLCMSDVNLCPTLTHFPYFLGDAETKQNTTTFTVGGDVASQQNGNIWASENAIVSLSLNGTLNVFDSRDNSSWRKIHVSRQYTSGETSANRRPIIGAHKSRYRLDTGSRTRTHLLYWVIRWIRAGVRPALRRSACCRGSVRGGSDLWNER